MTSKRKTFKRFKMRNHYTVSLRWEWKDGSKPYKTDKSLRKEVRERTAKTAAALMGFHK